MSDKDQFTFDDDDDGFPGTGLDNQNEPQELHLSDEDDFPGTNPDNHNESPGLDLSDNDDFPETDLNAAFSEGEYVAEESLQNEPELMQSAGSTRTRILLMILLLVIVGGAGAYYFMTLGGTAPSPPTLPVARTSTQSVDPPPQPGKAPAVQVKTEPAAMPASVTVAPPPPPPAEPAAPAEQPNTVVNSSAAPAATPEEKAVAEKPKEKAAEQPEQVVVPVTEQSAAVTKPASEPALAQENAAVNVLPVSRSAEPATPLEPSLQAVDGAFSLDAGSYLLESNRDSLVTKIRKLGYEPLITPVDVTLDMTRLRLGTFDQDKVQETLDFARSIEPESYSLPAGDRYVIYAGTFLKSSNIDTLSQRFLEEGIKVYPEPVQVVRTLSRIRFGGFASKEEASAAARAAGAAGVKASVVKFP